MSWHFICLTSQSHRTRMISIIKWHLTIKHPKGISSKPHYLHYKFTTDASILHIFEGYWAKNSSWMEVLARDMPSWRVKIIFDMVRGLREVIASLLIINICQKTITLHWLGVINSYSLNFPSNVVKNKTQKTVIFSDKNRSTNFGVIFSEMWLAESRIPFRLLPPIKFYLFYLWKCSNLFTTIIHNNYERPWELVQTKSYE